MSPDPGWSPMRRARPARVCGSCTLESLAARRCPWRLRSATRRRGEMIKTPSRPQASARRKARMRRHLHAAVQGNDEC
eukprot:3472256-Rhodomonas_salina.1